MSSSGQNPGSFDQNNGEKKNKGRQKVIMMKIENETKLQVTFSKRRAGLFKKASELCTLCGVEVAVVVFSQGNKVYSFGHPSVEEIADRLLDRDYDSCNIHASIMDRLIQERINNMGNESLPEHIMGYVRAKSNLEDQKKWGTEIEQKKRVAQGEKWYPTEKDVDEMSQVQLQEMKQRLLKLKKNVQEQGLVTTMLVPNDLSRPNQGLNDPDFVGVGSGNHFQFVGTQTLGLPDPSFFNNASGSMITGFVDVSGTNMFNANIPFASTGFSFPLCFSGPSSLIAPVPFAGSTGSSNAPFSPFPGGSTSVLNDPGTGLQVSDYLTSTDNTELFSFDHPVENSAMVQHTGGGANSSSVMRSYDPTTIGNNKGFSTSDGFENLKK